VCDRVRSAAVFFKDTCWTMLTWVASAGVQVVESRVGSDVGLPSVSTMQILLRSEHVNLCEPSTTDLISA
jgi:hypothetical protein